jgi:hypothetical protein
MRAERGKPSSAEVTNFLHFFVEDCISAPVHKHENAFERAGCCGLIELRQELWTEGNHANRGDGLTVRLRSEKAEQRGPYGRLIKPEILVAREGLEPPTPGL